LRLPYIKELGVGVIYLNPIFMAYSNHRYDTANYMKVDPMLGTEEDFKNLCAEAHAMDIKIILDGVFSHTGSNSIYFDKNKIFGGGAYSDENSQYKSWYTFEKYSGKYTSWWGIDTLPCVNELDSTYMDYIIREKNSVVEHWLKAGADGFRLDVVDEIPDEFVSILRKQIKKIKPGALLIGEVWEDASNKISYGKRRKYFADSELDSVMNYPFRESIIGYVKGSITGTNFKERIMTIVENYPRMVVNCLMNVLSTHDTRRVLTEFGDDGKTRTKAEKAYFRLGGKELERALAFEMLAVLIQFTLPGMPCIYYGDEIGMEGYEDPLNRCFFSWDKVNENLRGFYAKLAKIKNENLPLKIGNVYFRACGGNSIEFVREYEGNRVVVKAVRADWEYKGKDTLFTLKTPYASAIIYKE
ncbi:MAG: glycoside hydrolase family 13 protein, partial [Bacillota bacterium]|nr:glycoside hydrolase family 13 protein [Bacillota bacterium]